MRFIAPAFALVLLACGNACASDGIALLRGDNALLWDKLVRQMIEDAQGSLPEGEHKRTLAVRAKNGQSFYSVRLNMEGKLKKATAADGYISVFDVEKLTLKYRRREPQVLFGIPEDPRLRKLNNVLSKPLFHKGRLRLALTPQGRVLDGAASGWNLGTCRKPFLIAPAALKTDFYTLSILKIQLSSAIRALAGACLRRVH